MAIKSTTIPEEAVRAETLWAVNILGPDDLIAAPDYMSAVRMANAFNAWWLDLKTKQPHNDAIDARMWAVPTDWEGNDARGHADELSKPHPEYQWLRDALSALELSAADMGNPITLTYTNYRGETSERTITPIRPWFGSTEWHSEPQWLLTAFDHEKQANRDFAIKDFGWPQPKVEKGDTFKGTVDGDTELQAAAREAGWALIELVDEIDWLKREQVSDIITRLGIALNEPSDEVDTIEVGIPATELSTASKMEVVAETGIPATEPSAARKLALEEDDLQELLERLDAGLEYEGELETENDHIELFNVEAAQDLFADAATAIRALSSPDHADAGKVEGDGWLPIDSAPKDGTEIIARRSNRFKAFSCFFCHGEWLHYDHEDGLISYRPTEWKPFPQSSAPASEGAE